jgi:hypothetical protein
MRSDAFVRGIMGPYGSGKSTACVMEIIRRANQQRKNAAGIRCSRWAVIRNTYPELKTTTIKTWHQWVPTTLGRWVDTGPPTHHIRAGELDLEVIFISLDRPQDVSKLLGMELTGAWIDEAREIPKAVLDGLTGRVGRFPSQLMGGSEWSGIIMSTNPPDTDHWWYRLAEEQRPEGFAFFRQPGGLHPDAENRANLPADYYERQMSGKDQDWIRVYVMAEYGFVMDGKVVYPEFKDGTHCREFDLMPRSPLYIGMDFGLTPAAVFAQRTIAGAWRWHSELVTEDMGVIRFAEMVRRTLNERYPGMVIAKITGDPAGDQRQGGDSEERTVFQLLAANGVKADPAPTNDFGKRREAVAFYLNKMIDGEPGLLVHPQCRLLRKAMAGGYCYKRIQVTGMERFRDVPDKTFYSHIAEAAQYLMMGAGEGQTIIRRQESGPRPAVASLEYNYFGD